jgi:hypothetical protein
MACVRSVELFLNANSGRLSEILPLIDTSRENIGQPVQVPIIGTRKNSFLRLAFVSRMRAKGD